MFLNTKKIGNLRYILCAKNQCTLRYVAIYKEPDTMRHILIFKKKTFFFTFINCIYKRKEKCFFF